MKKRLVISTLILLLLTATPSLAYELYFGDLHSHTSFSDGQGLPEDAYDMARNEAGLDFWTVSDHVEQINTAKNPISGSDVDDEWEYTRKVAAEKTEPGKFIAMAGWEWAMDPSQGHMNVLNVDEITSFAEAYPLKKFYRWISRHEGMIAGYNHPHEGSDVKKVFDHMAFVGPVARQIYFVATNVPADFPFLFMALDNGWWLAPSAHQDNHSRNWGLHPNGCLTAVYADELSYDSLLEAFNARRFYATTERALHINFGANNLPMGSRITAPKAVLNIQAHQVDGEYIDSVNLISNGGKTIESWRPDGPDFETDYEVSATDDPAWYLILVKRANRFSISAPIWLKK